MESFSNPNLLWSPFLSSYVLVLYIVFAGNVKDAIISKLHSVFSLDLQQRLLILE